MSEAEQTDSSSTTEPESEAESVSPPDPTWLVWSGLIGIVLIALIAGIGRLLHLTTYPPGLADAEFDHGLLARQASDFGIRSAMENAETLSIPLVAVIAAIGTITGFDAETPRIAAAIFGALSILFTGLWAFRAMGPVWGIAAAAVLGGSFWHILFSRLAIGSIVAACALAAFCWLLTEAAHRRDQAALPWYLFAGIAAGVGFLSAPAFRLLPLVLIGALAVCLYQLRQNTGPSEARNWLISTAAAYLTISPYLISHRDDLHQWTPWATTPGLPGENQTTIPTLATAIIDTATSLVIPGDRYIEMNLPGDAWLSVLMIPWAVIGILGLIRAWNHPDLQQHFSVGIGVLISVLLGVSAVDAGHPGQVLILGPALAVVTVFGIQTVIRWARVTTVRYALISLAIVGILGQAFISVQSYVDEWAPDPDTAPHFNASVIDALLATASLDTNELVIINADGYEMVRDYFRTPGRILFQSHPDALPFPEGEDGYLITANGDIPLEDRLARLSLPTGLRDDTRIRLYRLDGRIREEMPLSVPTVQYPNGPILHGNSEPSRIGDDSVEVLIAFKSPAQSPQFSVETRLRTSGVSPITTSTTTVLPANPLQGRLFQVLRVRLELPDQDQPLDLEIRLRRDDDTIVPVGGMTDDGFFVLNRYTFFTP